jgi:hypothetical protein
VRADRESRPSTYMNPLANQKLTRYPTRHLGAGFECPDSAPRASRPRGKTEPTSCGTVGHSSGGVSDPLRLGEWVRGRAPQRGSLTPPLAPLLRHVTGSVGGTERRLVVASGCHATFGLAEGCRRRAFQKGPVLNVLRTNGLTENEGVDRDLALRPLHRPSAVSADRFVSRAEKPGGGQNRFLSLSPVCPLRPQCRQSPRGDETRD